MGKPAFDPSLPFSVAGSDKPKFDPSQPYSDAQIPSDQSISGLESTARGLAQGASLGFADEITGGGEALLDKIRGNDAALSDLYARHRDESRAAYDAAQAANPKLYTTGQLGGAVATAFIPGLGEMNLGKAAALGAAQGLGDSTADLTKGEIGKAALDTGKGAAIGAVVSKAAPLIGKGISKAGTAAMDAADWTLGKIGRVGAGVSEDVTSRYLENPNAVRGALSSDEIAESVMDRGGVLEQLKNHVSALDSKAWDKLSTEPNIPKADILQDGESFVQSILTGKNGNIARSGGVGASADKIKAVQNSLQEIEDAYGTHLSQSDLKSIVADLQKAAYGMEGNPKYTAQAEGIRQLSGIYNGALKELNPSYAQAMEPVAEATDHLAAFQKNFVNKMDPDGLDKSFQAIKSFGRKSDLSSAKQAVNYADQKLGTTLDSDIQANADQGQFLKTDTNGSRKTLFGSVVGAGAGFLAGGPVGAFVGLGAGGTVGQVADKYAGVAFQKLLDGRLYGEDAVNFLGTQGSQIVGKYAPVLQNAAQRGPQAVAATHFILQQTDPHYREMIRKINGESDGN